MAFTVAIVGRPNVGKSTLFNRLVRRRAALVDNTPGVTRDRREGDAHLGDLAFRVIDTAGLDAGDADSLTGRMQRQTETAIAGADLVLLVIDARAGVTPIDEHFARSIRRTHRRVVLIANKCEGAAGDAGLIDAFSLGLGEPVAISAEHNEGMADLYRAVADVAPDEEASPNDGQDGPLQLAIVGRPNVGKSTLVNRLIGEDRLLTGPEPGITRDSISVEWTVSGRTIQLVDTAGLRRKARVQGKLEKLSAADTQRSIDYAEAVAVIIDATVGPERQDLAIAGSVVEEGRALIIAANKWDLVANSAERERQIWDRLSISLPQVKGVPLVRLSALTGAGVGDLLPAVLRAHRLWTSRLDTGPLNRWLASAAQRHPPPSPSGRRIRLRYITQAKTRPPTFALFASRTEAIPDAYVRFLVNDLRAVFDLPGVPIRLHLRKGGNPYAPKR